jgi:CRP/FNR family transcriptional regulator, dissimilatory nitrate respiration regulator
MHSTESLGEMRLFKGLPERLVSYLENHSTFRRIEEGEFLFKAGDVPRSFVVVVAGQLKFSRTNKAGKEQVFGYAQSGDVCGLSALTDPYRPCATDAIARASSEVIEIELSVLRDKLHSENALAMAVLNEMTRQLNGMVNLVDQLSLKDAHNRLALWLENWLAKNHPDAGDKDVLIVLPYTQSEVAAQIGTVREVVSRGFSRMEKEGILKASGKRVTILSRSKLREMANA